MNTNSEKAFVERHASNGSSSMSLPLHSVDGHGVLLQWRSFPRKRFWRYLCQGFGGKLTTLQAIPFHFTLQTRVLPFTPYSSVYRTYSQWNRRLGRSLGVTWHLWLTREEKVIEEPFSIHSVTIWVLAVFGYTRDSRVQRAACVFERTREGSWGISQSGGPATQSFLLPMENYLKYHFEEWLMVACSLLLLGC